MIKTIIGLLTSIIFFTMEIVGFFFTYAIAVYKITGGLDIGWIGLAVMFAAAVISTFGIYLAALKWGY